MRWICAYDIADDSRRRKVAECLEMHGLRVQRSVFECDLGAALWQALREQILEEIDEVEDRVMWCPQCQRDVERQQVYGVRSDSFALSTVYLFD